MELAFYGLPGGPAGGSRRGPSTSALALGTAWPNSLITVTGTARVAQKFREISGPARNFMTVL